MRQTIRLKNSFGRLKATVDRVEVQLSRLGVPRAILVSLLFFGVGCQSWLSESDGDRTVGSVLMNEAAGAQSVSSDPNPASASRNVGQSGTVTDSSGNTAGENIISPKRR